MGDILVSGLDIIGHNRPLRRHWLRRMAAFLVDAVLVLFPLWIVLEVLQIRPIYIFGFASGMLFFLYSSISEGLWSRTPGKEMLGLKVYSLMGKMELHKAMIRNASKFFWYVLPLLDTIFGLASSGDPRQRLSDRIAKTTIVKATVSAPIPRKSQDKWVRVVRKS
ncbi:MAG: RDD family protein [Methanobacteriota archaeon]|nr:MAG: RDD family protein [Euryarchaeota archaeon]